MGEFVNAQQRTVAALTMTLRGSVCLRWSRRPRRTVASAMLADTAPHMMTGTRAATGRGGGWCRPKSGKVAGALLRPRTRATARAVTAVSGVKTWCGGGGRSATTTAAGAGAPQVDPAPPGAVARPAGSLLPSGRRRLHLQRQPAAAALLPGRGRLTSPAGEGLAGQPHPLTKGGKGSADGTGSSARSAAGRAAAAPAAGGAKSNSWSAVGAAAGGRTARWPCLARAASLGSGCGQAERGRR